MHGQATITSKSSVLMHVGACWCMVKVIPMCTYILTALHMYVIDYTTMSIHRLQQSSASVRI